MFARSVLTTFDFGGSFIQMAFGGKCKRYLYKE